MSCFHYTHFRRNSVRTLDCMLKFWRRQMTFRSNIGHFVLIKFKQWTKNMTSIVSSNLINLQRPKRPFRTVRVTMRTPAITEYGLHGQCAMVAVCRRELEMKVHQKKKLRSVLVLISVSLMYPIILTKSLKPVRLKMDGHFGVINNHIKELWTVYQFMKGHFHMLFDLHSKLWINFTLIHSNIICVREL